MVAVTETTTTATGEEGALSVQQPQHLASSTSSSSISLCWQENDGLELVQQLEEFFKENDALKQANRAHANHTSLLLQQINLLTKENARLFNIQTQQQQQKEEQMQKEQEQQNEEKEKNRDKQDQQEVRDHARDGMVTDLQLVVLKMKESYRHKIKNVTAQLRVSQEHLHELRRTVSGCPLCSGGVCGGDRQNKSCTLTTTNKTAPIIMDDEFISSSSEQDTIIATVTALTPTTKPTPPPNAVSASTRQLEDRVMDRAIHIHTAIMKTSIIKIDDHDEDDENNDDCGALFSAVEQKRKQTSTSSSSSNIKSSNKNRCKSVEQHKTSNNLVRSWHGRMRYTSSKNGKNNNNSKHANGGDSIKVVGEHEQEHKQNDSSPASASSEEEHDVTVSSVSIHDCCGGSASLCSSSAFLLSSSAESSNNKNNNNNNNTTNNTNNSKKQKEMEKDVIVPHHMLMGPRTRRRIRLHGNSGSSSSSIRNTSGGIGSVSIISVDSTIDSSGSGSARKGT
jgi:hypothetical protein